MEIIYKGRICTGVQTNASLNILRDSLLKVDLLWSIDLFFDIHEQRGCLFVCALLADKEIEIRNILEIILQHDSLSTGELYCYGEHPNDVRRFVLTNGRLYEQQANIEYEEPGRMIYQRI